MNRVHHEAWPPAALHLLHTLFQAERVQVDTAAVQQTVTDLVDCLVRKSPGLECPLAQSMMTRVGPAWTPRYVGVLRTVTCDDQDPAPSIKSDFSRFVWNFLAGAVSSGVAALANGA